jgi:putative membrane protein
MHLAYVLASSSNHSESFMKTLVFALLCTLPLASIAADSPDASFYKKAAQAGNSEVEAGRMAQDKGASQAVKDFGAMMVKDHTAANSKLQKIAAGRGIELPTGAGLMNKTKEDMTDLRSGSSFDKSYIKSQIKAHEDTVKLLQDEIASGKDADAQAFATDTLPTVKAHLAKILRGNLSESQRERLTPCGARVTWRPRAVL